MCGRSIVTDGIIAFLQQLLLNIFQYPWIVVFLLAALPIVEARMAIPMAIAYGYKGFAPFLLGFAGSTVAAPILLLVFIPFIKWLSKTKLFKRLGEVVYEKFEKKADSVDANASDFKKMLGVFIFVAVPLPLTGVWTGCAIASIIKLSYPKALISICAGNAVACAILAALCALFPQRVINYIITAIGVIAIIIVLFILYKAFLGKKQTDKNSDKTE